MRARIGAEGVVGAEGDEQGERQDLEGQARDHDVVACVRGGVGVGGDRGHAAACGLEDEGGDVAGDDFRAGGLFCYSGERDVRELGRGGWGRTDAWVRAGRDARGFRAEGGDDVGDCQVDCCG